jgi:hypothetical protein
MTNFANLELGIHVPKTHCGKTARMWLNEASVIRTPSGIYEIFTKEGDIIQFNSLYDLVIHGVELETTEGTRRKIERLHKKCEQMMAKELSL